MAGVTVLAVSLILNLIPISLLLLIFFHYPTGLIYSSLLILGIGIFAISPINESIGRFSLGCRPPTTEESRKILGSWNQVLGAVDKSLDGKTGARFEKVELFVSDEKLPNAFALGNNTICVTKGLLNFSSSANMAGVLAHEAGHLHFGDSQRLAIAVTANQLGILSYNLLGIITVLVDAAGKVISGLTQSRNPVVSLMGVAYSLFAIVVNVSLRVLCFVSQFSLKLSICAVGRGEEFRADLFAKNIGFGQPLAKFLRGIEALEGAPKNIWQVLYSTHPPTAERIDRLEK
ncbi:M48 family metalloprotease [Sporomusa aerivorans]|uniref:M48 family metalloprotease n=1 Tax=Sporomusa aerivorans TaxID=204936 RepID=UPI00352AA607